MDVQQVFVVLYTFCIKTLILATTQYTVTVNHMILFFKSISGVAGIVLIPC